MIHRWLTVRLLLLGRVGRLLWRIGWLVLRWILLPLYISLSVPACLLRISRGSTYDWVDSNQTWLRATASSLGFRRSAVRYAAEDWKELVKVYLRLTVARGK